MKTMPNVCDVKALLDKAASIDIGETAKAQGELEDAIFHRLDRIEALSSVQSRLDSCDSATPFPNRVHFSNVLEEEISNLRHLMERHFG